MPLSPHAPVMPRDFRRDRGAGRSVAVVLLACWLVASIGACHSTSPTTDDGVDAGGSTSTTTTSSTLTSESESNGFVMEPDCGVPCPVDCDVLLQDCPEGEKCTAGVKSGSCYVEINLCAPVTGAGRLGEFCTRAGNGDDCGDGLFCLRAGECTGQDGTGVCVAFCREDLGCDGFGIEDAECILGDDTVLALCGGECNPLASSCSVGHGCYDGWRGEFMCMETMLTDAGDDGAPCDRVQGCSPGLLCQPASTLPDCADDHCCTPICDLSGDGSECTNMMESCVPYFDGIVPPGLEQVGLCGLA